MKTIFSLFVCLSTINIATISAQNIIDCGSNQLEISNVQCVPNGSGPSDDFLSFTLTVTNLNSNSGGSGQVYQLPANSTWTGSDMGTGTSIDIEDGETFNVMSPSAGCAPVDFLVSLQGSGSGDCNGTAAQAAVDNSAIPTMGQWGVIVLGLLSVIVGLIAIKQKRWILT